MPKDPNHTRKCSTVAWARLAHARKQHAACSIIQSAIRPFLRQATERSCAPPPLKCWSQASHQEVKGMLRSGVLSLPTRKGW